MTAVGYPVFDFQNNPPPQIAQITSLVSTTLGYFNKALQGQITVKKARDIIKCLFQDLEDFEVPCEQYALKIVLPKTKGCNFKWYINIRVKYYCCSPDNPNTTVVVFCSFSVMPDYLGTHGMLMVYPLLNDHVYDRNKVNALYVDATLVLPADAYPIVTFKTRVRWNTVRTSWTNGETMQVPKYTQITFITSDGSPHTVTSTGVSGLDSFNLSIPSGSDSTYPLSVDHTFTQIGTYTVTDTISGAITLYVRVVDGCCVKNQCDSEPLSVASLITNPCRRFC